MVVPKVAASGASPSGEVELVALRVSRSATLQALEEVWARGAAALPLDPRAPAGTAEGVLEALRPTSLADEVGERRLRGGRGVGVGTALVVTTSGSTGSVRAAELSHAALVASAQATATRLGLGPDDAWLCCLPTHHIGGLQVLLRARRYGAGLIVHESFDVDAVAAAPAAGARVVSLVPTMLVRLLDAGVDLSGFRVILLGGGPVRPDLVEAAARAGGRVVTTYGMTETCGGCVYDGEPLPGVSWRLGRGGRIELSGPVLMSGYRLDPRATARALVGGWLRTGDVGEVAADGRLRVLGRADDVIISGGEKIVPAEVAALLAGHPGVAEAEVVGVEDREWGRAAVAFVVPADPDQPPAEQALRTWCAGRAAAHLIPRRIEVVATLPRLPTGKVDRAALIERASAR